MVLPGHLLGVDGGAANNLWRAGTDPRKVIEFMQPSEIFYIMSGSFLISAPSRFKPFLLSKVARLDSRATVGGTRCEGWDNTSQDSNELL